MFSNQLSFDIVSIEDEIIIDSPPQILASSSSFTRVTPLSNNLASALWGTSHGMWCPNSFFTYFQILIYFFFFPMNTGFKFYFSMRFKTATSNRLGSILWLAWWYPMTCFIYMTRVGIPSLISRVPTHPEKSWSCGIQTQSWKVMEKSWNTVSVMKKSWILKDYELYGFM